ncbi:MAG TPA: YicC/YloC family endoribonuclease, partial [Polyangiaceae bacterium]|nr:YicC/YloC family endoribonuclease [Polyangiaceae bacterium]
MTGFGLGEAPLAGGRLAVEIRGVNHKFLDVRVRAPRELAELGGLVEQLARERLARGRYEVAMRADGVQLGAPVLDREKARAAYKALCELRDEVAPGSEVPLTLLGSMPELWTPAADREMERLREATRTAFDAAVASLDAMRAREGRALHDDLARRLEKVRRLARDVEKRAPEVVEAHRKRLRERADRLR